MRIHRVCKQILLLLFVLSVFLQGCDFSARQDAQRVRESRVQIEAGAKLLDEGQRKSALKAFDKAVALSSDLETYMTVVGLLTANEMYEESIPYIKSAIGLPAGRKTQSSRAKSEFWDSELYTVLGDAYVHLNRLSEAEVAYRQAVRLNRSNATAYNNWGYMYADSSIKLDEALRLSKRAVDLEPDNGYFADSVGWAYFRKGDREKALEFLKSAVELCPSDAEIRYHLGRAFEAQGNVRAALVEYHKALKLSSSHKPARERIQHLHRKSS